MRHFAFLFLFAAASAFAQEIAVSDPTFAAQPVDRPRVTATGDRFITVWGGRNGGVFASLTDLNGTLVRGPVTLTLTGRFPATAGGTDASLIAWLDDIDLYTAILDKQGNVSAPKLLVRSASTLPSVFWNGSYFLVLTGSVASGVTGYLLDENGERRSDELAIGDRFSSATADGDAFLIFAYTNVDANHPEKGATIWARRIESSGTLEPWTRTTTEVTFPRLAAVGQTLFWEYNGVLHRVITDAFGAPLSDSIIASGTLELQKAVDTGSGVLLSFSGIPLKWSLMFVGRDRRMVSAYGPVSGVISDLAAIGTRALIATNTDYGGVFRGLLVDATSTLHVSDPINVGEMAVDQMFPQVASNGRLFLAVWLEVSTGQLFAARIDPQSGKHLDGRGILLDSHQNFAAPAVAALGDGFVVAYLEVSSGVAHLMIRRVFPDGTLDPAPTLVSPTAQPWAPRLTSDGNQALLVWTENTYSVNGTRLSRDGAVLDPAFLRVASGDTSPGEATLTFAPDVGIDGDNYLVAWQKNIGSGRSTRIGMSAVHVSPSGTVLNPPVSLEKLWYFPRVASDAVAATAGGDHVFVSILGGPTLDLGANIGLGDIERFGNGLLVVGTERPAFGKPDKLWAAQIVDGNVLGRFNPLPYPAPAYTPTLTRTPTGVALTYLRVTGDEGYGGALRAYVLPISEQRRRTASQAR